METMTTTSESANNSTVFEIFSQLKGKGPTHNPDAVLVTSVDTCLRYGQPDEKPVGKRLWHCQ